MSASGSKKKYHNPNKILPHPDFTINEIREVIPAHLFEHSLIKSFGYLIMDLVFTFSIVLLTKFSLKFLPSWFVFPLYTIAQGVVWTGFWIIAHECGHGGFSKYRSVNDAVGLVLHSFLQVPYHSWRITHGIHHKNTSHIERDAVFLPKVKDNCDEIDIESPIMSLIGIFQILIFGWPMYLTTNITGPKYGDGKPVSHYEPSAAHFQPSDRNYIIQSVIGIAVTWVLFAIFIYKFSFFEFIVWYFIPYLWVNLWLIIITYLQHTDPRIAHYKDEEWTFVRGGLSTVDRDFGPILNFCFHHITDSHVVHHLFSAMPFYNAIEATPYVKARLGKYYFEDNQPVAKALYNSWRSCRYILKGKAELYQSNLN